MSELVNNEGIFAFLSLGSICLIRELLWRKAVKALKTTYKPLPTIVLNHAKLNGAINENDSPYRAR